jgi:AcrR family transcriptional regulator
MSGRGDKTDDPRWIRTRERLIRAGFELFGSHGADGVSVDAIIARAAISKQTFYNHFENREAFVRELWIEAGRHVEQAIAAANQGIDDPVSRLARGVMVYARLTLDDQLYGQFIARAPHRSVALEPGVNVRLGRDLLEARQMGRLQFRALETAQLFVSGCCLILIEHVLAARGSADMPQLCFDVVLMILGAFHCEEAEAKRVARATVASVIGAM